MNIELLKPKIALIASAFPKLSETFIVNKFLGLLDNGWNIHIVCNQSETVEWGRYPKLVDRENIRSQIHINWPLEPRWLVVFLFPIALLRALVLSPEGFFRYFTKGWSRFGLVIIRKFYLDAELIILKPDIVHFEFGSLAVGRMYLKDLLSCKITVSFRGYDLNFVRLDEPDFYRDVWVQADAVHFLGNDLWQRAQKRGCPVGKPHVLIPPAIDTEIFTSQKREILPVGSPSRPFRILSVGRLEWKKGYEYAIQAVRILCDQGVRCDYKIIGAGSYLDAIAFARHQLKLENAVEILGSKSHTEVIDWMNWADVFLHAAISEGFCNAVIEAQAMELPVVCSDAGGLTENVADGVTGFVVPRRNSQLLAEKLLTLANSPQLRKKMGSNGKIRVYEKFRLEEQNESFNQFYRSVL